MVCVLQRPHPEYALVGIEGRHSSEEIERDHLDNLFGLARIVDDAHCHAEHKLVIAIKKNRQSIVLAGQQTGHQLLIGQ